MLIIPLVASILTAGPASATDWMSIANSYGNWTTDTLNTSLLNQSLTGGSRQPKPEWPGINEDNVQSTVFTPELLRQLIDSNSQRARRLLVNRTIIIEGVTRKGRKADFIVSLEPVEAGASSIITKIDMRGSNLRRPADGTHMRYLARVRKIEGVSIVSLDKPRMASPTAGTTANRTVPTGKQPAIRNTIGAAKHAALQFRRSDAVSRNLNEKMATVLTPSLKAGYSRRDILNFLNSGKLQAAYRQLTQRKGLINNNLGDVVAGSMIINWEVVHRANDDDGISNVTVRAVRDDARNSLAKQSVFAQMNDSQKQMVADTLINGTTMIFARYKRAVDTGNEQAVRQAQQNARQMIMKFMKVDLQNVRLTTAGFQ